MEQKNYKSRKRGNSGRNKILVEKIELIFLPFKLISDEEGSYSLKLQF